MTLGIMQPYLFPYIGYWQLIEAVDTFIIYDDVTFIKQGYINKNFILVCEEAKSFTLELMGASSNKLINEIEVGNNGKKILKTIKQNYIKAAYFKDVIPIIEEILNNKEKNLAKFIGYSIEKIAEYLAIDTIFLYSSQVKKNMELKAQDKVLDICKNLSTSDYINAIGGQELYNKDIFKRNGINLSFMKTNSIQYSQFQNKFISNLSIIDIMMFNDIKTIQLYLKDFKLI